MYYIIIMFLIILLVCLIYYNLSIIKFTNNIVMIITCQVLWLNLALLFDLHVYQSRKRGI